MNLYTSLKVDNFRIAPLYTKQYKEIADLECFGNHLIVGYESTIELLDRNSGKL